MQAKITESAYRRALESSLKLITFDTFDRSSSESFSFEELFYPLEIAEGKYAFQSYAEQMDHARKTAEQRRNTIDKDGFVSAKASAIKEKISYKLSQPNSSVDEDEIHALRREILRKIQDQQLNQENTQRIPTIEEKALRIEGVKNDAGSIAISSGADTPSEGKGELSTLAFYT